MPDELEICMAALFLNKGKDVLTVKEFTMYASLDLRWMQVNDAGMLMNALIEKKFMSKTGDYLRPLTDISDVDVPVAYRPSEDLLKAVRTKAPKEPAAKKKDDGGLLPKLIAAATGVGMGKGAFISECNRISKRTDVDIEVAAMMILKERGADVSPFVAETRSAILGR